MVTTITRWTAQAMQDNYVVRKNDMNAIFDSELIWPLTFKLVYVGLQ